MPKLSNGASRSAMAPVNSSLALTSLLYQIRQLKAISCQCGNIYSGEMWAGISSQVLGKGANMNNEAKKNQAS